MSGTQPPAADAFPIDIDTKTSDTDALNPEQTFSDLMATHITSKANAESALLLTLVSSIQKLETELIHERTERTKLQESIAERNVTDDEQLQQLTKTVDTLLFNLQGYESSAIAREDDNEIERANQAKRRSLEKKKKLQVLKQKEQERLKKEQENVAANDQKEQAEAIANKAALVQAKAAAVAEQQEEVEEAIANKAAFAKAQALADEQDRVQDLKRKEKEIEMSKQATDANDAKRWYAASIIQVAFRHYSHMKIWKSAIDMGSKRVKDGNAISARIAKLEKMVIDLNSYRQRQEDELIEASRLAQELKKQGKFGSPELQQVIEKINNALDGKSSKEEAIEIVSSVELTMEQVASVRTEQADIREEMRLANERAAAAGLMQVQDQLAETKNELSKALSELELASSTASNQQQLEIKELTEQLHHLQTEHSALGDALGVATTKDPNAVDVDAALEDLENKMDALRIAKLDDKDLEKKMQPLMDQLGKVGGSLSSLQTANKKVTESTIINQQKLANESKKTKALTQNLERLKTLTENMKPGSRGGGSSNTDDELKDQHDMLMEDISSRLSLATEDAALASKKNKEMLRNLDGRLRSHSGQVGTTLERLGKEVESKVSESELKDLQDRLKNDFEPTLNMVGGMSSKMNSMTTKEDVNKMIQLLRKKQDELSAIGVKCLVCSQNVPGGMAAKSAWKHKQFPGGANRTKILEEMRTKTFDGRIGHKLQKELKSPLRRAGALRQMKGKWEKGWGGNVSNNALPQDGYGPVGWTRIESNEAYVDRLTGSLPSVGGRNFAEHASGSMDPSREEIGYDATNGRPAIKKKIKMQPRHAKSNPIFPKVDSVQNGLEFGLSVKKRSHVLKV